MQPNRPVKFSLVHPSRGRPEKCLAAAKEWIDHSSKKNAVEYILSLDTDDAQNYGLEALARQTILKVLVSDNKTMVEAVNRGATASTGDIVVYVSDDMGCPERWDALLLERLKASPYGIDDVFCFFVHDGWWGPDVLQSISILSRGWLRRFGHVYHPDYISMCADTDYTEMAKALGQIVNARDLVFEHRHYTNGKAKEDATYLRQNSAAAWERGRAVLQRRRAERFGLP